MFHDENAGFFRRLAWSPEGMLLPAPSSPQPFEQFVLQASRLFGDPCCVHLVIRSTSETQVS